MLPQNTRTKHAPTRQDIDNYPVEHAILDALKSDPAAMALVDEFFFEEHVSGDAWACVALCCVVLWCVVVWCCRVFGEGRAPVTRSHLLLVHVFYAHAR